MVVDSKPIDFFINFDNVHLSLRAFFPGNCFLSRFLTVALLYFCSVDRAQATHVYGADFYYEHVRDNDYRLFLVVYGDCSGQAFPSLEGAKCLVSVFQGGKLQDTVQLFQEGAGVEVTPICPKLISQSACKSPPGNIPGVKRYIYTREYSMPYRAKDWSFFFGGNMGTQAGRSNSITNVLNGGTLSLTITLNNLSFESGNSSPIFTTIPTPFYCLSRQLYNQGAVDRDGDSMVYQLVPALLNGNGLAPVTYSPGFSATHPLATTTGGFSFDSLSGQLDFTPDRIQRSLAVTRVTEYRNGIVVGTAMREMTFIIIPNCENTPVFSRMDTLTESYMGGVPKNTTFYACEATDSIHFSIVPELAVPDTIFAEVTGLPKGASLYIDRNNSPNPRIAINWKTRNVPAGSYYIFVSYTDNDCPLNSRQFQAYTIMLTPQPQASFTGPDTLCSNAIGIFEFNGQFGKGPLYQYAWEWDHPLKAEGENAGPWKVVWNNEQKKIVRLQVFENYCPSEVFEKTVFLKHSPYAAVSVPPEVCQYDTIHLQLIGNPNAEWDYLWDFGGAEIPGSKGAGPYTLRWNEPGKKRIILSTSWEGCTDSTISDLLVHPVPPVRILNAPGPVCIGDKVLLRADGGFSYSWFPTDSVLINPDGALYGQILRPIEYQVIALSEYGCVDSASIRYDIVEPCCNFSFPNAFTPNGDGRNDRFRIVTHGNHIRYELSIYNNWGQRVYYGLNAEEGWEGNFRGKPCEPGTYFYYLNATCYTGKQESHKGDLTLIR